MRQNLQKILLLLTAVLLAASPDALAGVPDREVSVTSKKLLIVKDIELLPPLYQPGGAPAPISEAQAIVRATFPSSMAGTVAELVRISGSKKVLDRKRLYRSGKVAFYTPPRGRNIFYRVRLISKTGKVRAITPRVSSKVWGKSHFRDEFNGSQLNLSVWHHRTTFYDSWGGRNCSKADPRAVTVRKGALEMRSILDPDRSDLCTGRMVDQTVLGQYPYRLQAHIATQSKVNFLYGFAAARMKMHRPKGQHASFWMLPEGLDYGKPVPDGVEIDVTEWFGEDDGKGMLANNLWLRKGDGDLVNYSKPLFMGKRFLEDRSKQWWDRYHVFSVERRPDKYIFRVDDKITWITSEGLSPHANFLLLSQLSSDYELEHLQDDPSQSPAAKVDWVKTWDIDY